MRSSAASLCAQGLSLSPFESTGRLRWVDAFSPPTSPPLSSFPAPLDLPSLFARLQRWSEEDEGSPLHMAVEDVDLLPVVGAAEEAAVHSLLARLQSLCRASSLVVWGHRDASPSSAAASLLSLLSSSADCQLTLSPLPTGASARVQGRLSALLRDEDSGCVRHHSQVHYRVTASGVEVFAKGRHTE